MPSNKTRFVQADVSCAWMEVNYEICEDRLRYRRRDGLAGHHPHVHGPWHLQVLWSARSSGCPAACVLPYCSRSETVPANHDSGDDGEGALGADACILLCARKDHYGGSSG